MQTNYYEEVLAHFQKLVQLNTKMMKVTPAQLVSEDEAMDLFTDQLQERETLMVAIDDLLERIKQTEDMGAEKPANEWKISLQETANHLEAQNKIIEEAIKVALSDLRSKAREARENRQHNRAYGQRSLASEGSFIDKRR